MSKTTDWFLDGIATFVLFYLLDLLKGYLLAGGSLPFTLAFIPQLDVFSVIILIISAILAFGRFYTPGNNSRKISRLTQDLHEQFPNLYELLFPPYSLEYKIKPDPPIFRNRSEYLSFATHMRNFAFLEGQTRGGMFNKQIGRAVREDVLRLVVPLTKSRRRYKLSLGEKVSDMFGFFP